MERHTSTMNRLLSLYMVLLMVASTADAHAQQEAPATPLPAGAIDPLDICTLPVSRLVFTLADLKTRNCSSDAYCSSLCWCRAWATFPVTASTAARCEAANDTSPCAGDSRDCRPVLAKQVIPTSAPPSATPTNNTTNMSSNASSPVPLPIPIALATKAPVNEAINASSEKKHGGISTVASIIIAVVCAAVLVALFFVTNWYRNRPRSISAPATVSSGIQSGASMRHRASTELDTFDEKMPSGSGWRPSNRGSIGSHHPGPMHVDSNASMISGISGASYHDMDGTRLGHLDEAHALTDTELSLSKDANERVFSPLSVHGVDTSSFLSTDSSVAIAPLGQRVGLEQYQRLQQEHRQNPYGGSASASSSFLSETSTTYLTNNESFTSQLTIPESDDGSTTSGPREVEF